MFVSRSPRQTAFAAVQRVWGRGPVSRLVKLAFALVPALLFVTAAPAMAGLDQDGRKTGTTAADGSYSRLVGNGFSATSGQCVLYAALSYDSTSDRQIESGLVRCNGAAIDGTCPDGQVFVERYNGSSYYCTPGYSFDNNTQYDATTYRTGATSTTFTGHINGAQMSQAGFGLSDSVRGYAWGEATGASTCPSPSKGTFTNWKRYDTSAGWSYVTSSTTHRYASGQSGAPCWDTISSPASDGGFYVD